MKVSVVIPTHNRSDLLKRAVNSVLKQSHKDLEVIIVSDGSTDDTSEVISKFESLDQRVKSISYSPAQGANVARNKGIEISQSEYIAFLDDDDEWYLDKLEKQLNVFANDSHIGLVYTGVNVIYVNEKEEYLSIGKAHGDLSKAIIKRNVIGTTSTVIVKKSILEEVGGFDSQLPAAQDYDLWIRVCQKTDVGVVPDPEIFYYNYTDKKQISSNIEKYEMARKRINEKYAYLFSKLSDEEKNNIQINVAISRANLALRNRQKKVAFKYIFKSISYKATKKNIGMLFLALLPYKYILRARKLF